MPQQESLFTGRNWTVSQLFKAVRKSLEPLYGGGEADAMSRLIFHSLKGWDLTGLIINGDREASEYLIEKIESIVRRALKHEPIQYILGDARFYGLNLKVNPHVLIPRVETEQLVDMIVAENQASDLRVLDIGTGSGAIAIALARNLRFPTVTAVDISPDALEVASQNARALKANIDFCVQDVFAYNPERDSFDIIVSNPPYIAEHEKEGMDKNVLGFEPHLALFVPDDNPLIFYSRIAEIASVALSDRGKVYFEINPLFADQIVSMLKSDGFADIEVVKDIAHRNRFVKAVKP